MLVSSRPPDSSLSGALGLPRVTGTGQPPSPAEQLPLRSVSEVAVEFPSGPVFGKTLDAKPAGGRRRVEKFGPPRAARRRTITMSARLLDADHTRYDGASWSLCDGASWNVCDGASWNLWDGASWNLCDGASWNLCDGASWN